jgi:hypothetical protein
VSLHSFPRFGISRTQEAFYRRKAREQYESARLLERGDGRDNAYDNDNCFPGKNPWHRDYIGFVGEHGCAMWTRIPMVFNPSGTPDCGDLRGDVVESKCADHPRAVWCVIPEFQLESTKKRYKYVVFSRYGDGWVEIVGWISRDEFLQKKVRPPEYVNRFHLNVWGIRAGEMRHPCRADLCSWVTEAENRKAGPGTEYCPWLEQ